MKLNTSFAARRRARSRAAGRGDCRDGCDARRRRRVAVKLADTRAALRDLWIGHVFWVRNVVDATFDGNDAAAAKRPSDRSSPMRKRSPAPSSRSTARPPRTSCSRCSPATGARSRAILTPGMPATRRGKDDASLKALLQNANEIAVFLGGANPNLPVDVLKGLLRRTARITCSRSRSSRRSSSTRKRRPGPRCRTTCT